MSEELNLDITELRRKRRQDDEGASGHRNGQHSDPRAHNGSTRVNPGVPLNSPSSILEPGPSPFNLWLLLEVLLRRWTWLLAAGGLCALVALLVGLKITTFTARVSLIRKENPNAYTTGGGENAAPQAYISRELSAQTLFALMCSPQVFEQASKKAVPPVRADHLARAVRVLPERNADFVTLALSGKEPKEVLAKWANLCADEVVSFTKVIQADEAGSISEFLSLKLIAIQNELKKINEEMTRFSERAQALDVDKEVEAYTRQVVDIETKAETARIERSTIDFRIESYQNALRGQTPSNDRLQSAQAELDRLRALGYTKFHPDVKRQEALLASAQRQGTTTNLAEGKMSGGSFASSVQLLILELQATKQVRDRELQEYEALRAKLREKAKELSQVAVQYSQLKAGQKRLEDLRVTLLSKQQESQLLKENALGYFKVHAYASPQDVSGRKRLFTVVFLATVGGLLGMFVAGVLALITEALDHRLKTVADLERVSRLPVLATLGDLRTMSPEEQISWAFRTLTLLQGRLNASSDQTLVCGVISSRHGEGRSTWINLLVSAASQRGMRVLTVATRPSTHEEEVPVHVSQSPGLLPANVSTTLTKNVLASPAEVMEQFNDPQAQPIVHIPLPGWVWNLERRQQWRNALESWETINNLVLLIELPPACQPESVLLAEHLPQVIWLASSGMADMEESRAQLETLRHARCNLVGAVLNREPTSFIRKYVGPWLRRFTVLLASVMTVAQAATPDQPSTPPIPSLTQTNTLPGLTPQKRAAWQERLTLGPGDSFDLSVFGHPELTRTNMVVGPDGRVNYLQIQDFPVAGLTIDELRAKFEAELGPMFVGGVRTIIIPGAFNSKKYFVLGKVINEGVFLLDRPLTVIEAVARAKGLQTGTGGSATEAADLSHSFLARQGKRVPVDFDRLFHQGDLSQNIPIEPNDYLYFAPASPQEIYVLGEVFGPGRVVASSGVTLIPAITARGGFTAKAYRKRVLVIRGSLQKPEAFAIDAPAILAGRTPDFKLQPKDIIYVNARPWYRVEELLDIAAQAFIEGAVTVWTGANVPEVFSRPIIPSL